MSRERVYRALAERPDHFLSGQELSHKLGISRAAVWKAVEGLRRQGYDIEARTGLGYRLCGAADRLGRREIASCLGLPRDNWQVLEEVDSTNTACKRMAADGAPDGTVVMADCQTAGKGRRGRSFSSPRGMGLYLSVLWRPDCSPESLLPLTALSAVAVCRAVERTGGVSPAIKWPNDLVLNGRKLGGILTELSLEGETGRVDYVVVGIGLNCRQRTEDFPPELRDMAVSLDMTLPHQVKRAAVAAALMEELDLLRAELLDDPGRWLADYRSRCLTVGRRVRIIGQTGAAEAEAVAVDDRYGLVVRRDDGIEEVLRAGEVSVRGLYGYV